MSENNDREKLLKIKEFLATLEREVQEARRILRGEKEWVAYIRALKNNSKIIGAENVGTGGIDVWRATSACKMETPSHVRSSFKGAVLNDR